MNFVVPPFLAGYVMAGGLIVSLGAQNVFVLRQGLKREHIGLVISFCILADALLVSAGVFGLGTAIDHAPGLLLLLTVCAAAFLACYGLAALRRSLSPAAFTAASLPRLSAPQAIARTALFTFLNPAVYLDTMLLLGSAGAAREAPVRPLFVVGAVSGGATWFIMLGLGASLLAPMFARPATWRVLDMAVGILMVSLAAGLATHAFAAWAEVL